LHHFARYASIFRVKGQQNMNAKDRENSQEMLLTNFCEGWKSVTGKDPVYGTDFGDLFTETLVAGYSTDEDAYQLGQTRARASMADEIENLRDRLRDAAKDCHGKGAGAERQLFERLQSEYEQITGESISEQQARA
jgi:hypothetical protein